MARKEEGPTQGLLSRALELKKSFRFRRGHTLSVKPVVRGTWLHWAWNRPKAMTVLGGHFSSCPSLGTVGIIPFPQLGTLGDKYTTGLLFIFARPHLSLSTGRHSGDSGRDGAVLAVDKEGGSCFLPENG